MARGRVIAQAAPEPLSRWEVARAAYDRFVDLKTRSTSKTTAKREREAFLAAVLGTEIDPQGYAIDPDASAERMIGKCPDCGDEVCNGGCCDGA